MSIRTRLEVATRIATADATGSDAVENIPVAGTAGMGMAVAGTASAGMTATGAPGMGIAVAGTASPTTAEPPIDSDYPTTPVPVIARKPFASLCLVLLGFTVFTPTMLAGAQVGTAFSFMGTLGVIALGTIILGAYVTTLGWIGARTGLTTVVMTRYTLGTRGAKFASVLLGGTQIGWYGVIIGTVGTLTAQAFDIQSRWAVVTIMVLASVFMCTTACFGYHGMYWVSAISTPLILALAVWVVFRCLREIGGLAGLMAASPSTSMPVAVGVTTVVGTFVAAGTQAPNWTRFARSGRQAAIACVCGFMVGNTAMLLFGAIGAMTFGEGDFVIILYNLGLVALGLVLMFGNLWKSNADTAYAFGVAGAELASAKSKTPFVIAGSVLGTLFAVFGVAGHLVGFLTVLGVFIPPLGGVVIGDYLAREILGWGGLGIAKLACAVSPSAAPNSDMALPSYPSYRWANIAAYVIASLFAWASSASGIGIAPATGIVVAMGLAMGAAKIGSGWRVHTHTA